MAFSTKNFEVVVAIDFGTSLSGFAYSFNFEREKIFVNSKWTGSGGVWWPMSIMTKIREN